MATTLSAAGETGTIRDNGRHLGLALLVIATAQLMVVLTYQHALAGGFDRAFLIAAAIAVLTVPVAVIMIRGDHSAS